MSSDVSAQAETGSAEPAPDREVVVQVEDLVAHYGEREILHGVAFDVRRGEIMVIMGGSGSGKTTLLRHLIGLERATRGCVELLGHNICAMTELEYFDFCRHIGVAFQSGALFSSLTVGENIELPLREHTRLDAHTMRIMTRMKLEVVDLAGFEDLMPSELSGGMIKRAAFARAIIMDPQLLFCDEPSAGLDPVVSRSLDELILRLRDAMEMSIVVVTHELESAFGIADRITVLDHGEVLLVGTVEEVRNSDNARVQSLLNRRLEDPEPDPDEYLARLTSRA